MGDIGEQAIEIIDRRSAPRAAGLPLEFVPIHGGHARVLIHDHGSGMLNDGVSAFNLSEWIGLGRPAGRRGAK